MHHEEIIILHRDRHHLENCTTCKENFQIVDGEREEVEWDYGIGCWEDDGPERFPANTMFKELKRDDPYERIFWLMVVDKRSNGGGLTFKTC